MKYTLVLLALLWHAALFAQEPTNLQTMQPDGDYENIKVEKLTTDPLATCFVIWVKKSVKAHYHVTHTENLYVLEGTGVMQLGDREIEIGPGSFVTIPKGTVHSVVVTSEQPLKVLSVQAPEFMGQDRHFIEE